MNPINEHYLKLPGALVVKLAYFAFSIQRHAGLMLIGLILSHSVKLSLALIRCERLMVEHAISPRQPQIQILPVLVQTEIIF